MPLYIDKTVPEAWQSAQQFSSAIDQAVAGSELEQREAELIKVRASQLNGCAFCLDLHSREARAAGLAQQKLDILPAWRESSLFDEREKAVLAIAEAATLLPLTEESRADLAASRALLGDHSFATAEWVAVSINMFNRISILSEHPVRERDIEGKLARKSG